MVATLLASAPAHAQQQGAPAVAAAESAYGLRVGAEEIGLYNSDAIRGFALDAGANYRLDGAFYLNLVGRSEMAELSTAIQAGPNLFAARFPSPTGVVDIDTNDQAAPARLLMARGDAWGSVAVLGRAAFALPGGAAWVGGDVTRQRDWHGGHTDYDYAALGARTAAGAWTLQAGATAGFYREAAPFSVFAAASPGKLPAYRPGRASPPDWARSVGDAGLLWGSAARDLGRSWQAKLSGAFGYFETDREAFVFLDDADADGRGELVASVFGRTRADMASGELRLERAWDAAHGPARMTLAVMGRDQRLALAPGVDVSLGAVRINDRVRAPDPGAPAGTAARDRIDELRVGASASYPLTGRLLLSGSVQRVRYGKRYAPVGGGGTARLDETWSGHAAATVAFTRRLSLYGAYVTGLEESGTAPAIAVNANETLPSLRATQYEGGAKLRFGKDGVLILSAFQIDKAAPGFDPDGVWRLAGLRRHRGADLSLVGGVGPVRVVAGLLWLDAAIREPDGRRAAVVGEPEWRGSLSAQWTASPRLAFDLNLYALGRTPARRDGATAIPARLESALGALWTAGRGDAAPTLRVSLDNALGVRGWTADLDESLTSIEPRTLRATLTLRR